MPYRFRFASNARYRYKPGDLFLGVDPAGAYEVGVTTERHAITIAGAGAGKGAALMIPNLLRWPHNALVIDPKGEAAEHTAAAREAMGQDVHVLDPFRVAKVPDRLRAQVNPLAGIRPDALDAREDVNVLADGLVMRHDPKAGHWDNGGLSVIAGMIAYVLDQVPPERRTLPEIRRLLTCPPDEFAAVIDAMGRCNAFGNLPAAGASKLTKTGSEAGHFQSTAEENTKWLDSPAMAAMLSASSFDLADLKAKPCTVYLVLPAHLLGEHGRFLRLFVRMALNAMAKGGPAGGRRCLFMLDEFYSLGRVDEIAKAAGLMRGYGVSLWPILQDLGQLESLYGRDGMHTFFGNADVHSFFGNTDAPTLDYVSRRIGPVSAEELPPPPDARPFSDYKGGLFTTVEQDREAHRIEEENRMRAHRYESGGQGSPRMAADQIRAHVTKEAADKPSRRMIVFAPGSDVLDVQLQPYFRPLPQLAPMPSSPPPAGPGLPDWIMPAAISLAVGVPAGLFLSGAWKSLFGQGPASMAVALVGTALVIGGALWLHAKGRA